MWTFRRAAACGAAVVACRLAISGQAFDLVAVATTLLLVGALVAVPFALALADPGALRGRWWPLASAGSGKHACNHPGAVIRTAAERARR